MGKKSSKNKKKCRKPSKKEREKFFVGNFLKQPARTRSGVRYSKKTKKASKENIFGSLVSCHSSRISSKVFKSLSKDRIKCRCKDCKLLKQKISESEFANLSKGYEIILKNPINVYPQTSKGIQSPISGIEKKKKKIKRKTSSTYFCTCDLCSHKSDGSLKKGRKRQSNTKSCARKLKASSSKVNDLRKLVLNKEKSKRKSHCKCKCCICNEKKKTKKKKRTPAISAGAMMNESDSEEENNSEDGQMLLFPSAGTPKKTSTKKKASSTKNKTNKKKSTTNNKKNTTSSRKTKNDKKVAPMPSANYYNDKEREADANYHKVQQTPTPSAREVDELKRELARQGIVSYNDAPVPSGTVPTYIAMVKTAIRDLKPFRVTNFDAISKYIRIRYHIRNDDLLEYILKWMIEMGVITKRHGHYKFTKKRLVKKETVAVLRRKRKHKSKKRKRGKKRKMKRKGKKKKAKSKKQTSKSGIVIDIFGVDKTKKSRKGKKGRKKKKSGKCTCSQELDAKKNRIKVKTKYVRRNGKIYKYDEYI